MRRPDNAEETAYKAAHRLRQARQAKKDLLGNIIIALAVLVVYPAACFFISAALIGTNKTDWYVLVCVVGSGLLALIPTYPFINIALRLRDEL